MSYRRCFVSTCLFVLAAPLALAANAAPMQPSAQDSGPSTPTYYDSQADITWLANGNANGAMNWSTAKSWAQNLTVNGVSGWRLPTTPQPDSSCSQQFSGSSYGTGCTGSEMGQLFYDELGGKANQSIDSIHNANYQQFSDILPDYYWSGTPYNMDPDSGYAWIFNFGNGEQDFDPKTASLNAFAVHPGRINGAPEQVPAPRAPWLLTLSSMLVMIGWRKARFSHRKSA